MITQSITSLFFCLALIFFYKSDASEVVLPWRLSNEDFEKIVIAELNENIKDDNLHSSVFIDAVYLLVVSGGARASSCELILQRLRKVRGDEWYIEQLKNLEIPYQRVSGTFWGQFDEPFQRKIYDEMPWLDPEFEWPWSDEK